MAGTTGISRIPNRRTGTTGIGRIANAAAGIVRVYTE
jgi:hypothetical protein